MPKLRPLWLLLLLLPLACNIPLSLPAGPETLPTRAELAAAVDEDTTAAQPATTEDTSLAVAETGEALPDDPPQPWTVAVAPGVPGELAAAVNTLVRERPSQFAWAAEDAPQLELAPGYEPAVASWVYALVGPFATLRDGVTGAELAAVWSTAEAAPLYLSPNTAAAFTALWGEPGPGVSIVPAEELAATLWAARGTAATAGGGPWGIVPFHQLTPDLKVLAVDGRSPLLRELDLDDYPLALPVGLVGDAAAAGELLAHWSGPASNRDEGRLTRVAMTGVTALVRATATEMERNGILWPGEEVGPVLRAADIAHISNEVAFNPNCPPPSYIGGTSFCSDDRYFALLEEIGTTLVELTGNHVNDKGSQYLSYTIDRYEAAGWQYFGGGRDLADAARPAIFEHNGNQIAFVGCNPVGPAFAWATATAPGSRPCDYAQLKAEIGQLRAEGHVVIATLQYWEHYNYTPTNQQKIDFRALAEAGATAVSGSQAHHVHGFDFHAGTFIHYGLGNLFFDQMDQLGTRQTFVDQYVIYDGRLLSVELWTGLIESYARPRLMSPIEREQLLRSTFAASGW